MTNINAPDNKVSILQNLQKFFFGTRPSPENFQPDSVQSEAQVPEVDKTEGSVEIGGPKGPEPTRFGDWEHKGRCTDF